jgi:hypothetical protein
MFIGRKLGNPLYSKVEAIVDQKGAYGSVKHSDFDSIRNKSSVRAILTSMGYKPCNEAKPSVWKEARKKSISTNSSIKAEKEMGTKTGQLVLDELKANGVYQVSSFSLSRKYLDNIIVEIRELGYSVTGIREGNLVKSYKLDAQ